MDTAVCVYGRLPDVRAKESAAMLATDPVGIVRAASVLTRDLADVEFADDDPADPCEITV